LAGGYYYAFYYNVEPETVSAAFVLTGANGLNKFVIEQLDIDKKHGFNLRIVGAEPGELERKMIVREVNVGAHSPLQLIQSQQKKAEIRVFAPLLTSVHSLMVPAASSVKSIEDLKGKKVAILPRASAGFESINLELRILGIEMDKEFLLTFASIPDISKFLNSGQVDAAFLPEPVSSQLIFSGKFREILNLSEEWQKRFGVPYFFTGTAAYADWVDNNKSIAKRYSAMQIDAFRAIRDNPVLVEKYVREVVKVEGEEAIKFVAKRLPAAFIFEWNEKVVDNAVFVMEKALEFGLIEALPENPRDFFIVF